MRLRILIEVEANPAMVEEIREMVASGRVVSLDPMAVKRDRITGAVVGAVPVDEDRAMLNGVGDRLIPGLLG